MREDKMDENMMNANRIAEVVLTYCPDDPKEVVLTYEAPLPPAMQDVQESAEQPVFRSKRRRTRRGGVIFGCFVGAFLLLVVAGLVIYALQPNKDDSRDDWDDKFHQYWDDYEDKAETAEKTTIPTYPTGGEFRLEPTEERGESLTAQQIYQTVNPAVVTVVAYLEKGGAGIGTGVIASEDGYIITNYHVVEGGNACDVILSGGYTHEAKLVGFDRENDIAVLKVEQAGLPVAAFGSSDLLTVGDNVYAIGNPLGMELRGTLTDGIVSAINRDVDVDGVTMTLIQTNAALNSGNSGGPLINEYGQVVGINTIKMVSNYAEDAIEGLGFAIPSSTVAHIANCLIATGEVQPEPVLGITVLTTFLPDGTTSGLEVRDVTPGFGGDIAGIQPGDIIVAADGETLDDSNDLLRCRRRYKEGESLPLTVCRNGEYIDVLVPLMVAD